MDELENEKLRFIIRKEKEASKLRLRRMEGEFGKLKRINEILISSNDNKDSIINDLKGDVNDKN